MSQTRLEGNFFDAVRQLADSEIELIKVIKESTMDRQKNTTDMKSSTKKKNIKKSSKLSNVKTQPSAALLAAKQEAAQRKILQNKKSNANFVYDIYQKIRDAYAVVRKETGIVYDRSMEDHKCLWDENYPECPERLTRILERCNELGLLNRCKLIQPRFCTENDILQMHTQKQIDILKETSGSMDLDKLETLSSKYDAIYVNPSTFKLSLLAVGSTINLIESICKGDIQNGMAIIRPPGHHAMKSEYCGYCFYNNVAIAAKKALNDNLANKILIVDWDVHHGQATQQMFYDDSRVVYFSIHRYENGTFWPNLEESDFHYIGEGLGEGYNFNIPLNKTGMTNADYIAIFQQVLLPMAYEFQSDLIIVSAGFDSAFGDEKGEMEITPACYAHLLSSLLSLATGKIAVILEGGYCLKSLAESAALTLRALLGDPCPMLQTLQSPSLSIRDTILNSIYAHKQYWKCYQYQEQYSINNRIVGKEGNNDQHLPIVNYTGEVYKPDFYETRNCYPIQNKDIFEELDKRLDLLIESTNLSKAPNKVCIVYDNRMLKHCDAVNNTHPEKPNRIVSIYKKHEEHGLLERCYLQQGRVATEEELLLAHSQDYINAIKKTETFKSKELERQASKYNSVYLHNETWFSACVSAGSLLQIVDNVLNGEAQSGVAVIRPPGHHAEPNAACGFCIFNNIAIAAKYAINIHNIKRILIVDWDVHHGNGTQFIFENDPSVLYTSIHRYDNGNFFPHSKQGNYTSVGLGSGEGYCVNIPWNKKGMGNAEYIAAFQQVVMPIAYQFNPELVLVSAGFDACIGDPLGGCTVTPEMYGHLTHWLSSLANGRVILSLEGGYNINSISHSMAICTKALLGDPLPLLDASLIPCSSAIHSINNVLKVQKKYWPNLMFNLSLPKENLKNIATNIKMNDQIKNFKFNQHSESKIALEGIESEKLDIKHAFNKYSMNKIISGEEILKLQNEIKNIQIRDSKIAKEAKTIEIARACVNKDQRKEEERKETAGSSNNPGNSNDSGENRGALDEAAATSLTDFLSDNWQALTDRKMFAVIPLKECPHLNTVNNVPPCGIDIHLPCMECNSKAENWICLQCYTVHCARSINQHALLHSDETLHPLTLSFSDLSVWCYGCSAYIDNPRLYAARNAAHLSKFNQEAPWIYGVQ
ncbi:histone deacetylase 6 isoform X2 [Polistes fuscatus]|uniref:histone deacetylase 6 isoform X2 n=1 Tax=Polistes fuscatus TaxID=30207 RepID=UPI001CA9C0B4|nr:histone deacetylase 6 isoform X2 [Polistes fuscatus]